LPGHYEGVHESKKKRHVMSHLKSAHVTIEADIVMETEQMQKSDDIQEVVSPPVVIVRTSPHNILFDFEAFETTLDHQQVPLAIFSHALEKVNYKYFFDYPADHVLGESLSKIKEAYVAFFNKRKNIISKCATEEEIAEQEERLATIIARIKEIISRKMFLAQRDLEGQRLTEKKSEASSRLSNMIDDFASPEHCKLHQAEKTANL